MDKHGSDTKAARAEAEAMGMPANLLDAVEQYLGNITQHAFRFSAN